MKYVIKNCDNYTELGKDWTCRSTIQNRKGCYECQDCTDCILKQVVELCKENLSSLETYVDVRSLECVILQNILNLLDIQEVE